jgi:hypothetical protein
VPLFASTEAHLPTILIGCCVDLAKAQGDETKAKLLLQLDEVAHLIFCKLKSNFLLANENEKLFL